MNKELISKNHFHFIGIGGIGMSAIAMALIKKGYSVSGSDLVKNQETQKLKELGVNIIWLMPTYPISKTKSKGPLGSYYAVSDYKGVNPEFGTLKDLKRLVYEAHQLGTSVHPKDFSIRNVCNF